mgnify:CR=1 FL=1|jgi:hypothetical protein
MGLCYPSLSLPHHGLSGEHIFECAHPERGWLSSLTLRSYGDVNKICESSRCTSVACMVKKQEWTWPVCSRCGGFYAEQTLSLGHGKLPPEPRCSCPQPSRQNRTRARPGEPPTLESARAYFKTPKSHDSSGPSISEQVELLTALRGSGALTEQEFVTLLRRLMAGGNS